MATSLPIYSSPRARGAKLARYNTLPEHSELSERLILSQAPSQFGWFDRHQNLYEYKQLLLRLAGDKQLEMQLQQTALLDKLERELERDKPSGGEVEQQEPLPAPKKSFKDAASTVVTVNKFLSQIKASIEEKNLTPRYPRRSCFNGVSRYRKHPQVAKITEIIECVKRVTWRQRVWNRIKFWRAFISIPISRIESLVESRFGSSAVSYFVLLRRLILLNFFVALLSVFIWFPALLPCPTVPINASDPNTPRVSACPKPMHNGPTQGLYLTSFLTGSGLDNTSLFLGFYVSNPSWDYKSAYFYTFFLSTFSILVYISYFLGQAYIDTYSIFNSARHISSYMANLVFGGWTYTLTNSFSVRSEHDRLRVVLRETVSECSPRHHSQRRYLFGLVDSALTNRSYAFKHAVYMSCLWVWRGLVWMLALTLLLLGALLIVTTALQRVCRHNLFLYGFIPSLWHTLLELAFSGLTALEFHDTQRKAMVSLIIKHLLMRLISLSSIYTVVVYIYFLSRCVGVSSISFPLCFSASKPGPIDCLASGCWETEVAKLFHEYLVAQLISSIVIRALIITLQNFARNGVFWLIGHCSLCRRIPGTVIGFIKSLFNPHFHLPKHVIKVIYIQSLVWSGMLFCPYQHVIGFLGFVLLYVSMFLFTMWNCKISPKQPRTARSNLIYYLILFSAFFFIMLALHFPLFQFVPSTNCGPFIGTDYYYEFYKNIHLKWISELLSFAVPRGNCTNLTSPLCVDRLTLVDGKFWNSPATGPLTVITCGIFLLYFATLKKKNDEILQLRKQVLLLAVDRSFYIQGNAHFLSALSQKYLEDKRGLSYVSTDDTNL